MDLCPDRSRSPSHDRSRTRDAYSSHHRFSRRSHERYDQLVAYSDAPAHRRRPRSRESPPSRHLDFSSKSLSHLRGASPHGGPRRLRRGASPHGAPSRLLRSASHHGGYRRLLRRASPHGGHLRLLRGASPPRGHPHISKWDSLQSQDLALPGDPFIGIFALQDAPPGASSLYREVPLRPNEDAMRRETLSPLNRSTHLELHPKSPLKSSIEACMQDPLIMIRIVIFASWRKNVLVQSLLLRANTLALVFLWIMAPISAILPRFRRLTHPALLRTRL